MIVVKDVCENMEYFLATGIVPTDTFWDDVWGLNKKVKSKKDFDIPGFSQKFEEVWSMRTKIVRTIYQNEVGRNTNSNICLMISDKLRISIKSANKLLSKVKNSNRRR